MTVSGPTIVYHGFVFCRGIKKTKKTKKAPGLHRRARDGPRGGRGPEGDVLRLNGSDGERPWAWD
jgi:hypothetical protein